MNWLVVDFGMEPIHIDDQVMAGTRDYLDRMGHKTCNIDGKLAVDRDSFPSDVDDRTIFAFIGQIYMKIGQEQGYTPER